MKAINIIMKGQPHKRGLRHGVIVKAKDFGITGYINYIQWGEELFIHAEGNHEVLDQYLLWLQNWSIELQLFMDYFPAIILKCPDFRICCDDSFLKEITPGKFNRLMMEK